MKIKDIDNKKMAEYESIRDKSNESYLYITEGIHPHFHAQWELLCVPKGRISVTINGETRILEKGTAVAGSLDIHQYEILEPNALGYVLTVAPKHTERLNKMIQNSVLREHFLTGEPHEEIVALLKIADRYQTTNKFVYGGLVETVLSIAAHNLQFEERPQKAEADMMRECLVYLGDNFATKISLESLAQKFGYSPNYFSTIFNAYVNMGLREYVNSIRADRAAALIINDKDVSDAAYECGFDCKRTFYRVFKARFGTSPQEYIKNLTNPIS